ncbi:aldolase [Acidipropionibacterium virtanenii]|uniref:Sulfofructosephosphate aldolase n=1 Tax=Acidipropionibacterium virtanenii TaxID=2057246 RepID=A0A344UQZ3_9ACTN|nr:aldolase [Acidipropionibacterium virtanenii]AXE37691.1 Sulfofructosephosphate aldolase [Acidipropionibacterium virtanenii]
MSSTLPLAPISRESGGLAMLAVDQREALRNMLVTARGRSISDADMTDFKVAAARELSPYASAVLVDHQFALDAVVAAEAIASSCALIASADEFHPGNGIPVDRVTIDTESTPRHAVELGAKAMKLLVLWRSDEDPQTRRSLVDEFVTRCHSQNLIAIIEPVVRTPRTHAEFDKETAILRAADELGDLGADLYKAEMPRGGRGTDEELYAACRELDSRIPTPWVILSSGVDADLFPNSVRQAVRAGAQGFLAGRAVWSCTLPLTNYNFTSALRDLAAARLSRLAQIVDETLASR